MPSWTAGRLFGTMGVFLLAAGAARAQTFAPYSEFQAMSLAEMDSLRIKVTYGGPQDYLVATLLLKRPDAPASLGTFVPYRRTGFEYSNDDGPIAAVAMTRQELRNIIDSVATYPDVTDGDVDSAGYVSFALMSTAGGTARVFEAIVNQASGRDLFRGLVAGARGNADAVRLLRNVSCDAAMRPPELPANAQGKAVVTFGGLRPDRSRKGVFVGKVRVVNNSGSTLPAPLSLIVIRVGGNAKLMEALGTTCALAPRGAYYVDLPVGPGLGPGKAVEKILHFTNPSLMKFDLEFRVFSGYGSR